MLSHLANAELGSDSDSVAGLVDIDYSGQNVTGATEAYPSQKLKAILSYYEGCWINSMGGVTASADSGMITQSIGADFTDLHDLYSTYGEFLPTGNDPTLGQNGSLLYVGGRGTAVTATTGFANPEDSFSALTGAVAPAQAPAGGGGE